MSPRVITKTYTYTKTRLNVVTDQFQLFFMTAGKSESEIDTLTRSIENRELESVGVFVEKDGYRIAEVSLEIDWSRHDQLIYSIGEKFNNDIPGWQEGVAPEPYVKVKNLRRLANEMGLPIRSWIQANQRIRGNPVEYRALCERLGYDYDLPAPPFKDETEDVSQYIDELEECKVTYRAAKWV